MKADLSKKNKKRKKSKKDIEKVKDNPFIKAFMKLGVFLVVAGLIFYSLKLFFDCLSSWPYFDVTTIKITGESLDTREAPQYCDIDLPVNIIKLNPARIARHIKEIHPDLKSVEVRKELPSTLIVAIKRRQPVAEVEAGGVFYRVDGEAFVLGCSEDMPLGGLVVIKGVRSSRISKAKLEVCGSQRLRDALGLLALLIETGLLDKYNITEIDVSSHRNYIFFIDATVEIKLGRDSFRRKLDNLSRHLSSDKLEGIKYIDLRFEDIVVGHY
ncbi:MAG: cell division protein FtsQ/DivIB [Candidatus Omnitrophica bacterium]|nr:cell division protein FtsQ/DivIB [Candidatus Omnitrophota bacterium]